MGRLAISILLAAAACTGVGGCTNGAVTGAPLLNLSLGLAVMTPSSGSITGGTDVTIRGANFTTGADTTVTLGGVEMLNVAVVDTATITARTPAGTALGAADLAVRNSRGTVRVPRAFVYEISAAIAAITPSQGPVSGGTDIAVRGSGFTATQDTVLTIAGREVTNLNVTGPTTLTATTPAGPGLGAADVRIRNANGTAALAAGFTYGVAVAVSGVNPARGPVAGGTSVLLSGEGFTSSSDTAVSFGGVRAAKVEVLDSRTLLCAAPAAAAAGVVDVSLTNSNGSTQARGAYGYESLVSFAAIAPARGPMGGGTPLLITGAGFTNAADTTLTIGGQPVTNLKVISDTSITATAPPGAAGATNVTLANSNGPATLVGGYTYENGVVVTGVSPASGPPAGGTNVTIRGGGFTGAAVVTIGGAQATNVTVVDAQTLTATTPPGAAGSVLVAVSSNVGSFTLVGGYVYASAMAITGVSPASGPLTGGRTVAITGAGFTAAGDLTVTFGGAQGTDLSVLSATTASVAVPAGAALGAVPVVVSSAMLADTRTLAAGYRYVDAVRVTSVSPASGNQAGGAVAVIAGEGFTSSADTVVTFGDARAQSVVVYDATRQSAVIPAGLALGAVDVRVQNGNGAATLAGGYTYVQGASLAAVTPASGPLAGGTPLTITGAGFTSAGDTDLRVGGLPVTNLVVADAGRMTATAPAGTTAGAVTVALTNRNGAASLASAYTYVRVVSAQSVTPASGPLAGGTLAAVNGEGFTTVADTVVRFGAVAATQVQVASDRVMNVVAPAGLALGAVDVTVTNSSGTSVRVGGYAYAASTALTTVSPASGVVTGGTNVTLTGSGFTGPPDTTVRFGDRQATSVTVTGPGQMTVVAPAGGAIGTVDVTVVNANGTSVLAGAFQYVSALAINDFNPKSGPVAGGTAVAVTGAGFAGANLAVTFGGTAAASVTVTNDTTISAITPPGPVGLATLTVSASTGTANVLNGFGYTSTVTLASVAPTQGLVSGGGTLTVTGSGFTSIANTTVVIGGRSAAVKSLPSSTSMTVVVPAASGPGLADVTVSNSNGTATLDDVFTYQTGTAITGLSLTSGPLAGGTVVTVSGAGFTTLGDTTCTFGARPATVLQVSNSASLLVVTPGQDASGPVAVTVRNSNGAATLANAYTYDALVAISALTPTVGRLTGGVVVTVSGRGFTTKADTTVTFGGTAATVVAVSAGAVTVVTPARGAAGAVDVVVSNGAGSATLTAGFEYVNQVTLTGVAPNSGSVAGGTSVTLTGTGFTTPTDTSVLFGGRSAVGVQVTSATQMVVVSPAGAAAGAVDVVALNSLGSATAAGGFTYIATAAAAAPTITSIAPAAGFLGGGTVVTITGTNFTTTADTVVLFGGRAAAGAVVSSATSITAVTPAGAAAGAVDVRVANAAGDVTSAGAFTYTPVTLTGVAPVSGRLTGGNTLTLTGTGFTTASGTSVTIGGRAAGGVTVASITSMTVVAPSAAAAGAVDVVVSNVNGTATLAGGYTYAAGVTVTSVLPSTGPIQGGLTVTVTGTGFTSAVDTVISFASAGAGAITVSSATKMTCKVPQGSGLGAVNVTVTNGNGAGTVASGFTYTTAPFVASITPSARLFNSAVGAAALDVVIKGASFTNSNDVAVIIGKSSSGTAPVRFDVNSVVANRPAVVDVNTINLKIPADPPGGGPSWVRGANDVIVATSNGAFTLENGFAFSLLQDVTAGGAQYSIPAESAVDDVGGDGTWAGAADFDGDGDQDLYIVNDDDPDFYFENSNALGTFTDASAKIPSGAGQVLQNNSDKTHTTDGVIYDFDGDGRLDLLLARHSNRTSVILLNHLNQVPSRWDGQEFDAVTRDTEGVAIGDVQGNGRQWIFFGNDADNNRLFEMTASMTFVERTALMPDLGDTENSIDGIFLDVDADGDRDLFVANNNAADFLFIWNQATNTFNQRALPAVANNASMQPSSGDFDGDGDLDIVVPKHADGVCDLWMNDGQGNFTNEASFRLPQVNTITEEVGVADFDRDGDLDFLLANGTIGTLRQNKIYINNGAGIFTDHSTSYLENPPTVHSTYALFFDADGDGDLDVYVTCDNNAQQADRILRNNFFRNN
ncbi:MAG: IPT/TIG domain-containing protein [Planctomycetes bacterium]|nr:IPT/TIG domain-containing protein [Planctomycetota bacterium]